MIVVLDLSSSRVSSRILESTAGLYGALTMREVQREQNLSQESLMGIEFENILEWPYHFSDWAFDRWLDTSSSSQMFPPGNVLRQHSFPL